MSLSARSATSSRPSRIEALLGGDVKRSLGVYKALTSHTIKHTSTMVPSSPYPNMVASLTFLRLLHGPVQTLRGVCLAHLEPRALRAKTRKSPKQACWQLSPRFSAFCLSAYPNLLENGSKFCPLRYTQLILGGVWQSLPFSAEPLPGIGSTCYKYSSPASFPWAGFV